ncbi:MAG: FMN-binding negative transcriptional regulator [Acidimicrobiales bacterium]
MYIARVDSGFGEEEWRGFVTSQGFGHLVAAGRRREVPVVVPTQFVLEGDEVILHLVGKNPVLGAIEEQPRVLMSVAGDWAFIPSSWKAVGDEDPLLGVPTTYYAAVQMEGRATIVSDPADVAGVLRRQLAALQPGVEIADPLTAHAALLGTIRAIRIVIEEVRAKFKYGGNVDVAHREAVIAALERRGRPSDLAAARQTRRRIDASSK